MGKSFPLQSLFQALHQAVSQAAHTAQQASLEMLTDYFTEIKDADGNPSGVYVPRTMSLALPQHDGDEIKHVKHDVPVFSLVKHQAMSLETLEMVFDVELHGLDDLDKGDTCEDVAVSTPTGPFRRKTMAKVTMTFKGSNPPEGTMRLNDKILKTFPS